MRRLLLLALLAAPAFAAEPSKFTLAQSGAAADPLTVLGPASVCADQQIALWNGASNTSLQCSVLTVADTTGNLTGPAGGFTITGGTAASDTLTLDSTSNATNGAVKIAAGNAFRLMLLDTDAGNYESLNVTASAGAFDIRPAQAGAGSDNIALTLAGEGATATLTLDGSDDVAGSVSISAAGVITATGSGTHQIIGGGGSGVTILGGGGGQRVSVGDTSVVFGPTYQQTWGSSGFTGADVGLTRNAAGVVRVTDASTGIGKLLNARVVTPDIDGETTTAVQSGTVWTNTGDGDGEAITLLNDPTIGAQYCFAVDVAQLITIAPSTGESLYYGTDQCGVSLTSNSIGSTLCVTAISGGSGAKWFTMSDKGSWTCND